MGEAWRRWRGFCGPGLAPVLYPLFAVALATWLTGPLEGLLAGWGAPVAPRGAWGWWLARAAAALGGIVVAGGLLLLRWRVRRELAGKATEPGRGGESHEG